MPFCPSRWIRQPNRLVGGGDDQFASAICAGGLFRWIDDMYHPDAPSFRLAFNVVELEALTLFHNRFDQITHGRNKISFAVDLETLLQNDFWRQLMEEAASLATKGQCYGLASVMDLIVGRANGFPDLGWVRGKTLPGRFP
jgi:hypothetical protein